MADQSRSTTPPLTLEELRHAVQDKEHKLSELDVMLADYHAERTCLIRELRRLQVKLRDAEEAASSAPKL